MLFSWVTATQLKPGIFHLRINVQHLWNSYERVVNCYSTNGTWYRLSSPHHKSAPHELKPGMEVRNFHALGKFITHCYSSCCLRCTWGTVSCVPDIDRYSSISGAHFSIHLCFFTLNRSSESSLCFFHGVCRHQRG